MTNANNDYLANIHKFELNKIKKLSFTQRENFSFMNNAKIGERLLINT